MKIAGCNDCHTRDYARTSGAVSESQWLTGNNIGWQGPWGTTYPPNLRLLAQGLTREQWLAIVLAAVFIGAAMLFWTHRSSPHEHFEQGREGFPINKASLRRRLGGSLPSRRANA